MSVMCEQMMQQQGEHLQIMQGLTIAFYAHISNLIKGLTIPPTIAPQLDVLFTGHNPNC